MTATRIPVRLGERSYDVVVGRGLLADSAHLPPAPEHARRAVVVSDEHVSPLYGRTVQTSLQARGLDTTAVTLPAGEEFKTLATVSELFGEFAELGLGRHDLVVALGGGVIGDIAGFAAATWHRGVAVVQMPTTLLAQTDAAIGGKTGVNLEHGKNLVGAFHQPRAVIADVATLRSLPSRELRAGLGEVAKYGFIADPAILDLLESAADEIMRADLDVLTDVVRRCVAVKAEVVSADERESGRRALLNYGHTFGHAFESLTAYRTYRHGEAVALGMVAAARLSELLGIAGPPLAERTVELLRGLGLPTGGLSLDPAAVWDRLERDKKATDGVRFVLCAEPGNALLVAEPDRGAVNEVLRSLAA